MLLDQMHWLWGPWSLQLPLSRLVLWGAWSLQRSLPRLVSNRS